jgi:hypothetical protein
VKELVRSSVENISKIISRDVATPPPQSYEDYK